MSIKVDNTTDLSNSDENGKRYAANFEFFPFHEGKTYSMYKGVLNGESCAYDRHGQWCVVRTFRNKTSNCETDWRSYILIASTAQKMAAQFHKEIGREILSFPRPLLAKVNQKSSFVGIFRMWNPHEKHLKPNETVLVEPFLEGHFMQFDSLIKEPTDQATAGVLNCRKSKHSGSNKNSNSRDSLEMQGYLEEHFLDLLAFSHFTWHASKKFLVTAFQGSYDDETSLFTFTNPTIHSLDQSFGEADRGLAGIEDFFEHHACRKNCSTWFRYEAPDPNGNEPEPLSSLHQPD